MKFTLSWLKEHLLTNASTDDIAETLTRIGFEVEELVNPADRLKGIIVARIEKAEQHPNADKLRVCQVNTGSTHLEVVCGAPNARAGLVSAFVEPGVVVPISGEPLKAAAIRGVKSNGMLCSPAELLLAEESQGILELPDDTALGIPVADALGLNDPVFTIAVTPNRGDCLSVRGVARDLMAAGLGSLHQRLYPTIATPVPCPLPINVEASVARECPFFVGRLIEGVQNKESPKWLQQRLLSIGLRPISALVDITNYILYDIGRPLHVFDADKIKGELLINPAHEGESFTALNGKTYALQAGMLVIRDQAHVLSLAGIMGGEASGCTAATTRVFVESAYFDPHSIAQTGRKLQLLSDSRHRFERGVDPGRVLKGLNMATQLILEICGGQPSTVVTAGSEPKPRHEIRLSRKRLHALSGIDVASAPLILEKLGFTFDGADSAPIWPNRDQATARRDIDALDDTLVAVAPSWRHDIKIEEDLIEEVLRIHGYHHLPSTPLPSFTSRNSSPSQTALIRRILAQRGLQEATTWSFVSPKFAEMFEGNKPELTLINPISADLAVMRPSLLPNLLLATKRNLDRGLAACALFEVGSQFTSAGLDGQHKVAAGIRSGMFLPPHWDSTSRKVDFYDVKGDTLTVLEQLGVPLAAHKVEPNGCASWYHPGRSVRILTHKGKCLATFGEIHPSVLQEIDCDKPCYGFEIYLDMLPSTAIRVPRKSLDLPALMPVERDFAFIVPERTLVEEMTKAIKKVDRLITDVSVFDIYMGKGVENGFKSVALRVTVQPRTATLTEQELTQMRETIVTQITKLFQGTLRS